MVAPGSGRVSPARFCAHHGDHAGLASAVERVDFPNRRFSLRKSTIARALVNHRLAGKATAAVSAPIALCA